MGVKETEKTASRKPNIAPQSRKACQHTALHGLEEKQWQKLRNGGGPVASLEQAQTSVPELQRSLASQQALVAGRSKTVSQLSTQRSAHRIFAMLSPLDRFSAGK